MSLFDSTNFEYQGNTENDVTLKTGEDIQQSIIDISSSALRSIKIFTPDLQRNLYDNEDFRNTLLNFARGNRHAQIQILTADTSKAIRHGHQLIRLAQKLTSVVQIRIQAEEYRNPSVSFILADQSKFLFKNPSNQYAFISECEYRHNRLELFFTSAWEQAEQDIETRNIF